MMNLNEKAAWIADTREVQVEYNNDLQKRWRQHFKAINLKTRPNGELYCKKTGMKFASEAKFDEHISKEDHEFIQEEKDAYVFKSKTFVLVFQNKYLSRI